MNLPPHFSTFVSGTVLAEISSILLAADTPETFSQAAERWGIWAALTLTLVLCLLWGLYKIVSFVLLTLVGLVEANQKCLTQVADAIQNAPCGTEWDSDEVVEEKTPGGEVKAVRRVLRRQRQREPRERTE